MNWLIATSESFSAEASGRSPRKLFIFIIGSIYLLDHSIKQTFDLIIKNDSLLATPESGTRHSKLRLSSWESGMPNSCFIRCSTAPRFARCPLRSLMKTTLPWYSTDIVGHASTLSSAPRWHLQSGSTFLQNRHCVSSLHAVFNIK